VARQSIEDLGRQSVDPPMQEHRLRVKGMIARTSLTLLDPA
jgi:hypothetical protein